MDKFQNIQFNNCSGIRRLAVTYTVEDSLDKFMDENSTSGCSCGNFSLTIKHWIL